MSSIKKVEAILRKRNKNIFGLLLYSVIFIYIAGLAYAFFVQAQEPDVETVYGSNVVRSQIKMNYSKFNSVPEALNAIITPIIEPSVFEDCMEHPEKYDIYDGQKTVETAPCFSNACWTETITIHGVSMQPTIYDNSPITIRQDSQYNLSVGKIIAYDSLGQVRGVYSTNAVHRIVGIENDALVVFKRQGNQNILMIRDAYNSTYSWNTNTLLDTYEKPYYILKGDNNDFCEIVPSNAIHGILVGV